MDLRLPAIILILLVTTTAKGSNAKSSQTKDGQSERCHYHSLTSPGITADSPVDVLKQPVDSLDIKIGQMILIGIGDRKNITADDEILQDISDGKMGGILLFEKNIATLHSFTGLHTLIETLQKKSAIPLFISIDEEGGKVHRLKEKYGFVSMPSAQQLGALNNIDSTDFYNQQLTKELSELGINLNYAPCLDLAINPKNTVLVTKERCFSSDPDIVTRHAQACIDAHHNHGILTAVKHFPGHGSSTGDSHLGLVDVSDTWHEIELAPYRRLIEKGKIDIIMTAHIMNTKWDTAYPATLSAKVVTGMLRGRLHFQGVIVSDDMQMYAISKNYGFEHAITLAVNAGVDMLMFGNNVTANEKPLTAGEIHRTIKKLVLDGKINYQRINESYRRIMLLKARL